MEPKGVKRGSGWKLRDEERQEVSTASGLQRQREKMNSWVPGITEQKLVSCGHVWQEVKPWKRLSYCCRHSQAEMGREGKNRMTLSCLQIHQCLLLTALTLSLADRYKVGWGGGRARSECESKQPQDWQTPDKYLTLCFMSMPGVCS